jgi:hypothetical protein
MTATLASNQVKVLEGEKDAHVNRHGNPEFGEEFVFGRLVAQVCLRQ